MSNVANIDTCVAGWWAELASDSTNPQPSYTLNGKQVSRSEWRSALLQNIKDAMELRNQEDPPYGRRQQRM